MKNVFEKLMQDFCRLCDIDDLNSVMQGAAINVDDVYFTLSYNEEDAPDRLFIYCDYGTVPEEREAEVYRALLETNLFIYDADTAVFSVSPETGHVICATRFALSSLKAEELRGVMTFLSQKAKEWRQHYFDVAAVDKMPASGSSASAKRLMENLNPGGKK